jgi:hypothetical protein
MPVFGEHPDQRAANRRVVFHQQKLCHGIDGIPVSRAAIANRKFRYNGLNLPLGPRMRSCGVHRRILFGVAAWLLGAATATAGSLLAISLLGQGITGDPGQLLTQDAVTRALASEAADASSPPVASASRQSASPSARATASATASATATPAAIAASAPAPDPATAAASGAGDGGTVFTSAGGEVVASCQPAGAYLISWSPLQGYEVDGVIRGPAATARVTFGPVTVSPTAREVTMVVSCSAGVPWVREVRDT